MDEENYKYWAFIVSGQKDRHWTGWLQKELPKFPVPKEIAEKTPGLENTTSFSPVFIEPNTRPDNADLPETLVKDLFHSR